MDKMISSNQSTFLKVCILVDCVVVVNELVNLYKNTKKEFLMFKVDFENFHDSISWIFLDYMLFRFGFSDE